MKNAIQKGIVQQNFDCLGQQGRGCRTQIQPYNPGQNHAACTETDAALTHARGAILTKEHDVEESMQKIKERFHWQQIGTFRPKRSQSIAIPRGDTLTWTSRKAQTHRRHPA